MIDKRYLAGFIDGEGCFNITRSRNVIYPRLMIANTNLDILKQIAKQYGGDITSRKLGPKKWKTFNNYRASWKIFRKIVYDVYPFLYIKKEQAKLCMDMLNTKDMNKRFIIKNKISKLNKKGI